jgi:hypothetical protein
MTTRKEQIEEAAKKHYAGLAALTYFIEGAEWADANPIKTIIDMDKALEDQSFKLAIAVEALEHMESFYGSNHSRAALEKIKDMK